MSWIALTEAHLTDRLSGAELAAWRKAALAPGQTDPVPGVLASVTGEVRGYVAAWRSNTMGDGVTIPDELLDAAMALVLVRLSNRLPISLTPERSDAAREARTLLRDVAAGKFTVATAATPADEQPGGIELASGDGATPTSTSLNGLL
jgi:hypothetical protein